MAKTLVEAYADRLSAAEKVLGINMSREKKVFTARILNTMNKKLTEALDNSVGTQRSDMGAYKVFCLNMANVVAPSLIADQILLDVPMDSIFGNIVYNEYVAGSNKGNVKLGESVFNTPFALPQDGNADGNYTAGLVTTDGLTASDYTSSTTVTIPLKWSKVTGKSIFITARDGSTPAGVSYFFDKDGNNKLYWSATKPVVTRTMAPNGDVAFDVTVPASATVVEAGTINYGSFRDATQGTSIPGSITLTTSTVLVDADTDVTVADALVTFDMQYYYDNVYVPQNDLPILNMRKKAIPVEAKVRRIAINYAQLAAYQNSTDYGEDLQQSLTKQAVGQLKYDIDVEAVRTLLDLAQQATRDTTSGIGSNKLVWDRTLPIGVKALAA